MQASVMNHEVIRAQKDKRVYSVGKEFALKIGVQSPCYFVQDYKFNPI